VKFNYMRIVSNITSPPRGNDLYSRKSVKTDSAVSSFEARITRQGTDKPATTSTAASDFLATSATMPGDEYLQLYRESAAANSSEARRAAEHKALIAAADDAAFENVGVGAEVEKLTTAEKQSAIEHLATTPYDSVLEQIKNGADVSYEDWQGLLSELNKAGAIDRSDYDAARVCGNNICIGYVDGNGVFVPFEGAVNFSVDGNGRAIAYHWGEDIPNISTWNSWTDGANDPLDYLDKWIERYTEWRDRMAAQKNDDGSAKYENLDPISQQITSLTNVANVIRGLIAE